MDNSRPPKTTLLILALVTLVTLVGCGGGSNNRATVLMGTIEGAPGTTSGLSLKVSNLEEDFDERVQIEDGEFSIRNVPEGFAKVSITRSGTTTDQLSIDVSLDDGQTTELEIFVYTWSPEAVGEFRQKVGSGSFGQPRVMGPTGSTLAVETDGSKVIETPSGMKATREPNDTVVVE